MAVLSVPRWDSWAALGTAVARECETGWGTSSKLPTLKGLTLKGNLLLESHWISVLTFHRHHPQIRSYIPQLAAVNTCGESKILTTVTQFVQPSLQGFPSEDTGPENVPVDASATSWLSCL
jgi:hypothetical protein